MRPLSLLLALFLTIPCFGQTVLVSSFTAKQRTIAAPVNFTVEPLIIGGWSNERIRFAYAFIGSNNAVTALSPYTEVKTGTDYSGQSIRIPGGDRTNCAVGFCAFWNKPDSQYPDAYFPCLPENGSNYIFHFAPGDLRLGGQRLIPDPNLGPSYNYIVPTTGKYWWNRGATGLEGQAIPDPTLAPIISSHGLPIGQYTVSAAYLLPNGGETTRSPPQTVNLTDDPAKGHYRAILCHRNEAVQQGVTATAIYVQNPQGSIFRSVFPRNYVTFYISKLGTPAKLPATATATWFSNPLVEALDSDAATIQLDTDITVDVAPVLPYKPNITLRRIASDYKTVTVLGKGELLTVNAEPHVYLEGLQFAGPSTSQGVNFCDHNGGCNFFQHFTRCNFRPSSGFWLQVDDSGAVVPNGSPLYVAGHTASECFFDDCYCQREGFIAGSQSVDFFFTRHRQDVGSDGRFESAALHAKGNKFLSMKYWGCDNSAHCLLNIHNEAGDLAIDVDNLFIDKHLPVLIQKGQNKSAAVSLRFGTMNRETGPQALCFAPNGPLTLKLDSFITQATKAYGMVKAFSLDPAEAQAIVVTGQE